MPPGEDPYLASASDLQIAYVRAGLDLFEVSVLLDAGREDQARELYRRFLAVIPFDPFPGLE
jgi:hypothetical protein